MMIRALRARFLASLALIMLARPVSAQDATWNSDGTGVYNTSTNWTPNMVPTGTASFGASNQNNVTFAPAITTVGGWTFNSGASAYTFANSVVLDFTGAGITINGGSATINNNLALLEFNNNSTAGSATINNFSGLVQFYDNSSAGNATIMTTGNQIQFHNNSTAANATITNNNIIFFLDNSSAGSASITNNGTFNNGIINFSDTSTGGTATINSNNLVRFLSNSTGGSAAITNTGPSAVVDFSGSTGPSGDGNLSVGSLAGPGNFYLGGDKLTVGSNNLSTTISGVISDCGATGVACNNRGATGGSLIKVGTGVLTLTGANTYTGGTTISAGTLQLGDGAAAGGIVGNVADNGTLAFDRSDTVTFPGVISGSGAVNQIGTGTTILTSANTYTGGTTISAGTLQLGDGAAAGGIVGNVADNGTLAFDRSDTVTFPGVISGSGAVNQIGTGTTILTGNDTYTGGTTISAGALQLGNGGAIGSIVGNATDNGTLAFDRSDTVTFPGVISGTGAVAQIGTGVTILTADNTYSGGTTVSAGTLVVGEPTSSSAALSGGGDVFVASGATFGGYGSVTGNVTNDGTIVAGNATPGFGTSPIGTFTIIGDLLNRGTVNLASDPIVGNVLQVNGNYLGANGFMNINTYLGRDNSPSDKLVINGGMATGNTQVRVNNAGGPGALTVANGIPIVVAINGAMTAAGAFALDYPAVAGDFEYDLFRGSRDSSAPNNWFLRSTFIAPPIPIPPTPIPPTPLPPNPFPPDPAPQPLPPGIHPIIGPRLSDYGVVQPIARELGMTMLGTLHERIGDTMTVENAGIGPVGPIQSAWGRFFGEQIDNSYQAFAAPNTNGQIFGFQAGLDVWRGSFIPEQRDALGVYFAYGNANLSVDGLVTNAAETAYVRTQTGTLGLNGYSVGGYWTHYGPGGWYLDAVVQGTIYGGNANAQFGSLGLNFTSNLPTTGTGVITSLEAGYPLALPMLGPRFILEPQAQILWQHVAFGQNSDNLQVVDLGSTSGATGRLGLRAQWTIPGQNNQVWQPYGRVNFWRAWGGNAATSFGNAAVPVPLVEQATWGEAAGGVTFKYNSQLSFYAQAGYDFALTNSTSIKGFKGDIGLRFTW
jgi:outer membrane autotransporter protein